MKNHQPDDVIDWQKSHGETTDERSLTQLTFIHLSGRVMAGAAWPFEEDEFLGNLEKPGETDWETVGFVGEGVYIYIYTMSHRNHEK